MQLFGREKYTRNDRIEDHFCPGWGVSAKERLDYVKGDEKSGMREMEMLAQVSSVTQMTWLSVSTKDCF